jgi:riboflavin biosynthesis pyrimidine reductase
VVLDGRLRTPEDARVVQPGTCIVTLADVSEERQRALRDRGAEIVLAPGRDGRVDLLAVGRVLKDRGIGSLLVEGGATVLTSFLRHRLADQVVAVLAPRVSGAGIDAVGDLGVTLMDGSIGFEDVTFAMLGTDAVFRGHPVWPE